MTRNIADPAIGIANGFGVPVSGSLIFQAA